MVKNKISIAKGVKISKGKAMKMKKKAGGSNVGEYKDVAKKSFCGPAGGSPSGSFPVNSKKRAKSAIKLAHNAPNPEGIKACVKRKFPSIRKNKK